MEQDLKKKQNRKVTIFAIILSVISVGLLIVGFLLVSSDKVVMLQSISNLSGKVENILGGNALSDKIAKASDIGVKSNIKLTSEYANLNANLILDYLENKTDKKSKFDVDLSMNDQALLGLDGVLANNNVYLNVDGITPKYYYTAFEYINVFSSLEQKDYDKIILLLKETVTDYIEEKDIKKEKTEITYNGKTKKVNKLSYAITNEVIADLITNFINSLKKEKELLNNIAKLMDTDSKEIVTVLDSFVKQLTYEEVKVGCYYNIYYYGFNKIVRYELADANNKPVLEYKVEETETINLYSENTNVMSLEIKDNKDGKTFTGIIKDINNENNMSFSGSVKGDTVNIVLKQDNVDIKVAITSTEEEKDNNYIINNKINLSVVAEGTEINVGTLDISLDYYFGKKATVDVTNSVEVNQMTQEDMMQIQNNLMNHPIYQMIMSMSGNIGLGL